MARADAHLTHWGAKISRSGKRVGNCRGAPLKRYPHPAFILRSVWNLAKMRTGWTTERLRQNIGIAWTKKSPWEQMPSLERWQKLCVMAGLPVAIGITLYAKCFVPPDLCHYVGCTVYAGKRKTPWKAAKAEYLELLNTLIRLAGHGAPIEIADLKDG